jgi:four helix bundle protein
MSTEIIVRQLLKSATSIGANIIEAQAAGSKRDFTNFLNYALKSASETRFWLGLLRDTKKSLAEVVRSLLEESKELANILAASILTLKVKR